MKCARRAASIDRMMDDVAAAPFCITLEPAGLVFSAAAGSTLLQAALQAGIRLPNSCRNGTCRTCLCLLKHGRVQHTIEWPGLSAEERQEGFILPCVARALSDLVIDAPAASPMSAARG